MRCSTREWAALNPRARYRDPLTIADVLASPLQVSPLHLLDCCLVTDGAGAFVMTSAARARTLRKPPVYVLGAATCTDHMGITQMPDLTTTPGAVSGARAFAMAGLGPADVDVLMGYDSFTITALLHLEDLGFCAKGEGGPFAAEGGLGPGGSLPMNTNGGGLSFTHPGMYGMFLHHRGRAPAARRGRGTPGRGGRGRRGPRVGHVPLRHVDRRARDRGHPVSAERDGPTERRAAANRAGGADPLRAARWAPRAGPSGRPPGRDACSCSGARACDRGVFFPRALCPHCGGDGLGGPLEWREASGRATVHAAVVEHRPEAAGAAFAHGEPFCIALVDLEEGVRMMTNMVGCPPE